MRSRRCRGSCVRSWTRSNVEHLRRRWGVTLLTTLHDDVLLGTQEPQILHRPPGVHSLDGAREAIELADAVGMTLDRAQILTLELALGERADGKWAAFEVCDVQPRQNGKGDVIQARELAGLFLFDEQLIIHTAHEFPTANEAFLRMAAVIDANPSLRSRVARIRYANGEQGVELKSGARLKYRARTGGAGRGFAGAALVVYDEAFALMSEHVAASLPTLSTHPNPQVWFASSAGMATSSQLWRLRRRALSGSGGRLAYSEHTAENVSISADGRVTSTPIDTDDRRLWALANPAAGGRIGWDFLESEYAAMEPERFARERLGVWDAEPDSTAVDPKISADGWARTLAPPTSAVAGEIVVGFDVGLDGEWSSIAIAAGSISDPYVEVVEHRQGVGWLPGRLVELIERWQPTAVGCNGAGASAAQVGPILVAFREAGISADLLHQLSSPAYRAACGGFYTDVVEGRLRRPDGQGPLDVAVGHASERALGEGWAWDGRNTAVPVSPLVAVTVARSLLPVEAVAPKPVFAY